MPMTILNNNAAALALNELNKNNSKVAKDLRKISSGSRPLGVADYAIGENMQAKIRALSQDIENVQNGRSLLKIGLGGIDDIVDELRGLKELALNSCNDHNNDVDRKILQREFDARKAHIESIAADTNYNGIILLDGRWSRFVKVAGSEAKTVQKSQTIQSDIVKGASSSQTLAPVTSIKTVTLPKQINTTTTKETLDTNPGETSTTTGPTTTTTTQTANQTQTAVKILASNETINSETSTASGNLTTIVRDSDILSTKSVTTTDINTVTTTTAMETVTTITSVKEVEVETPGDPYIIENGTTAITKDGVYEFAPDYYCEEGQVLRITAKNVQLNGSKNGVTLNDVYIVDNGVEDLYIKNLKIRNSFSTNVVSASVIRFDASANNKLHLLGNNSFNRVDFSYGRSNAVINIGGGLNIVGTGSLDIKSEGDHENAAMIGTDIDQQSDADIFIGRGVTVNLSSPGHSAMAAGIGAGYGGACGDISIGTGAKVNVNLPGAYPTNGDGAAIGASTTLAQNTQNCGNITIFSGAEVTVVANGGAGIGTGENDSGCGDIVIYSEAKVKALSNNGAGIGSGQMFDQSSYINTVGNITIYSYSSGNVVATSVNPNADDIGRGNLYYSSPIINIGTITLTDEYKYQEGGVLDTSELTNPGSVETKYEVTTTTITQTEITQTITETRTSTIETYDEAEHRIKTAVYEEIPATEDGEKLGNPLIIHTGTKANQNLPIYIEDMRLDALGIKYTLIDPLENAKNSLDIIDAAIEYALDKATSLGAYYNELEFTEANLTVSHENTISSESVIMDADMAKEMTNYTKHKMLSQAAQAMLSQANQNSSAVLSLLG